MNSARGGPVALSNARAELVGHGASAVPVVSDPGRHSGQEIAPAAFHILLGVMAREICQRTGSDTELRYGFHEHSGFALGPLLKKTYE